MVNKPCRGGWLCRRRESTSGGTCPRASAALAARPGRSEDKIAVCTRPLPAPGPQLDVKDIGRKVVVHNHGHGGSGGRCPRVPARSPRRRASRRVPGTSRLWAAARWASPAPARSCCSALARRSPSTPRSPPDVRSSSATGLLTPDSRICLASDAAPAFKTPWANMCRPSCRAFSNLPGLPSGAGAMDRPLRADRYAFRGAAPGMKRRIPFTSPGARKPRTPC